MPTNLCNAAQPGRPARISALRLGAALAASLWFACEAGPVHAQAAIVPTLGDLPETGTTAANIRQTSMPIAEAGLNGGSGHAESRRAGLSPEDARRYRGIFAAQREGDWETADKLSADVQDKRLMGHVAAQRLLHPDRKATYAELAAWMARYSDHGPAERIHTLAERRKTAGGPPLRSPRLGPAFNVADGDLERLGGYRAAPGGLFARVAAAKSPVAFDADAPADDGLSENDATDAGAKDEGTANGNAVSKGPLSVAPRGRGGPSRSAAAAEGERNRSRIEALLKKGDVKAAWDLLNTDDVALSMDPGEFDAARQRIADSFYQAGQLAEATAAASAGGSGKFAGQANWTAGLAAWRGKQYDRAARHFQTVVESHPRSPWTAAAAAYWAARAQLKSGKPEQARVNLAAAARFPHTFYGLLAVRTLGETPQLRWTAPTLTNAHLTAVARSGAGSRAVALLQIGEREAAEQELRRVNPNQGGAQGGKLLREALLALADQGGMAELAMQLGNVVVAPDGGAYDSALYPVPHWKPRDGFQVDRAVLFAVARLESRFDHRLVAPTGASGLMQIMPGTARYVRNRHDDIEDSSRAALLDPAENLEMGQRYIAELMEMPMVGGNLFYLGAAYNAGPGNLARWRKQFRDVKDPLLFIESLPFGETRAYLEKFLANYWIYRLRLGQDVASLDEVAAGRWPIYTPLDKSKVQPAAVTDDAEN